MRTLAHIVVIVAACLSAACSAHRSRLATWRLQSQGSRSILIPPGIAGSSKLKLTLASAVAPAGGSCAQSNGAIEVKRRRRRLALTVFPDSLAQKPPGWLAEWSAALETSHCIPPASAMRIAMQIAESVPLPLNSGLRLLHPNSTQSGQVDIGRQMRLEVISPIVNGDFSTEGPLVTSASSNGLSVSLSAAGFIGYETAWYAIRPRAQATGFFIAPEFAERHLHDQTEKRAEPASNYLRFSPNAAFYRLFYKSGETGYTAILVAGRTWPELEQNSAAVAKGSCANVASGLCVAIPKRVAINPFITATVNGSLLSLGWGSTVADAIRRAGERRPLALLEHLYVERLYNGAPVRVEFNPGDPAILNLVLSGGEAISWKVAAPRSSTADDSSPPR